MDNQQALHEWVYYDFGSQTLNGGKAQTVGTAWWPVIYTVYGYDLSVYASAAGSSANVTLSHGAMGGMRSACKWYYMYHVSPGSRTWLKCWYRTP